MSLVLLASRTRLAPSRSLLSVLRFRVVIEWIRTTKAITRMVLANTRTTGVFPGAKGNAIIMMAAGYDDD